MGNVSTTPDQRLINRVKENRVDVVDLVRAELAAGASPNASSVGESQRVRSYSPVPKNRTVARGLTPLWYAVHAGNVELVDVLLRAGADASLDVAADAVAGTTNVLCYAVSRIVSIESRLATQSTRNDEQRARDAEHIARALVAAGAAVTPAVSGATAPPGAGATTVHHAAAAADAELLRELLRRGADANANDGFSTPLHSLCSHILFALEHSNAPPRAATNEDNAARRERVCASARVLAQYGATFDRCAKLVCGNTDGESGDTLRERLESPAARRDEHWFATPLLAAFDDGAAHPLKPDMLPASNDK